MNFKHHSFGSFIIVCGHYGSGKTNFSINLAKFLVSQGRGVVLADMDIVNPYFRSSDYAGLLADMGVKVIAPRYARSNVDVPAIPAEIYSLFAPDGRSVIIDAGGDDAGATALGGLSAKIAQLSGYEMLYIINRNRPLTATPESAVQILREIEAASRVKATGLVNCTHLRRQTTPETVLSSLEYAETVSKLSGLPITSTCFPANCAAELEHTVPNPFPAEVFVKTPWE